MNDTTTLATAEVADVAELRGRVAAWRRAGERVALVPTMGALHAGHTALVARARELADRVVASIFVNPTQFGPHEDFSRYPRPRKRDLAALSAAGCDLAFLPEVTTLYPPGDTTWVECTGPSQGFEGDQRPGHFRGVATVVAKLFHLAQPDVAIFGEKDAQQLAVIRTMVRGLCLPIEIVGHPIVREADGLAMSSRNVYLEKEERLAARVLSRALGRAKTLIDAGEREAAPLLAAVRAELAAETSGSLDYAGLVDATSFAPIDRLAGACVLPIAFRLGKTRLLDNLQIEARSDGTAVARL